MINLNRPPLKDRATQENIFAPTWLRFFSQLGDALFGKWGKEERNYTRTNIAEAPDIQQISYLGKTVHYLLVWNEGTTFSTSILELDRTDYGVYPSGLFVVDDGQLKTSVALVDGKTITLPDLTTTKKLIVQGTALIKED